ncbi:hypothetical protein D3C72_2006600 [compost metagenome]
MGQITGQHGGARSALGIHHRHQLAACALFGMDLQQHAVDCRLQVVSRHWLGQEIPGAGLHRHAHAFTFIQRAADQQWRSLFERML